MQSRILKRGRFVATILGAGLCLGTAGLPPAFAAARQHSDVLPPGLRPVLYRSLVADARPTGRIAQNGCSSLANHGLKACFGRGGARFTAPDGKPLSLRLVAFGRAGTMAPPGTPRRSISGGRLAYRYPALTEWWQALPNGYEQGFGIRRRPAGAGRLTLTLMASRSPMRHGDNLAWGMLRYGGLAATDAHGQRLPATITTRGARIAINVDDRGAAYPLTVDPLVWIQQTVQAPPPVTVTVSAAQSAPAPASSITTASAFGAAVALDGETAFVGAPFTTVANSPQQGAVYVLTEATDRSWAQSGMLTAGDGAAYDQFGSQLAVSGTALLVGAPGAAIAGNPAQGAAYVFVPSAGTWIEAQKLTASDGAANDEFGSALALSGTTALVGARYAKVGGNASQGAVYAFTDTGGNWSETQKLTAADGSAGDLFGSAIVLDGAMALVGAPAASVDGNSLAGAVYAFTGTAGVWSETQKLTASDGAQGDLFGSAVVLDGATALIGAPDAAVSGQINQGGVYAFADAGGAWTEAAKLVADDGAQGDQFGAALSLDGDRAFVGNGSGSGSVYIFDASDGGWTQSEEFFGGSGYGVAVDFAGATALVGAPGGSGGTVYFYEPANLALAYSAPAEAKKKTRYTGDVILTNNAATASPPLSIVVLTPTGATLGSATATQGDCTVQTAGANCDLGQVAGNGGQAKVSAEFTVTAKPATTIANFAEVANATPPVTASAAVRVPAKPSSGGGGKFGLILLGLLGLLAAAGFLRRR